MEMIDAFVEGAKEGAKSYFAPLAWLWKKLKKYMEEVCV